MANTEDDEEILPCGRIKRSARYDVSEKYTNTQTRTQRSHGITNKMQSQTADFAPVPPPCELDEIYASCLILAYPLHYMKT